MDRAGHVRLFGLKQDMISISRTGEFTATLHVRFVYELVCTAAIVFLCYVPVTASVPV